MRCSNCKTENPDGLKFCNECGAALTRICAKCGFENVPSSKFCGECGESLIEPAASGLAAKTTERGRAMDDSARGREAGPTGERRHLTVLFCDLVGSTEIAARLDPEEWRETVAGYHRGAAEAIERFGGYVAKYLGDGVMALFGYPEAHDNDAERAARAGLAILDAIAKLNEDPAKPKLSARVGIDSGAVVVGVGAGTEADVFGDAPNIAARVQAVAEPGSVAITGATHRLVSGLFVVEERGAQTFKGLEQPVEICQVIRPSGMRGRFAAVAAVRGLTPFVGREDEVRLLMNRWERVKEGEGQVVVVMGEAGIGKSRLVRRFREQVASDSHTWIECATAPFFQNTPFYAVEEILQQSLQWEQRFAALEESLGAGGSAHTAAPSKMPSRSGQSAANLTPDQDRKRQLANLVSWTLATTRNQPLIIATEDLHWADPSTLELIQLLAEQGATARVLLLYTARPEFRLQWPPRAHHTQINLNRLSANNVRIMVREVAAQKGLSDATIATVVERTGGVPLFVEELTRAVLENGDAESSGRAIPATLHDSLMARLDRLGAAKEVAQVGAVIGAEFSYELLHAVHPIAEEELQSALARLADAELVYVRGIAPAATYQFKHALIRDVAYEALLKTNRRKLHRLIAQTITEKFPMLAEARPEVLARHWTEAGETELAITAWQKAGEQAVQRSAYREAEQHYGEALTMLQRLPESSERDARELTLQLALGSVMEATRSFSSVAAAEVYTRAGNLAVRGDNPESLRALMGLWAAANTRGEPKAAMAVAERMLEIAQRIGSQWALTLAHCVQGRSRNWIGDLVGARQHLLDAVGHYREEEFRGDPIDPGVRSLSWMGPNEWHLGHPDNALRYLGEARSLARRQNNPHNLAFAISISNQVHISCGDFARALEAEDEVLRLGTAFAFPLWSALGKVRRAWLRALMGEVAGSVEQVREGLAELDAMKFYLAREVHLVTLSETQALAGAVDDALVTIGEVLQLKSNELISRPEALRVRGRLRFASRPSKSHFQLAERDFREAIELARRMSAKSDELRATMSLARLLRDTDRRVEARAMLAAIYGWFTEGFDTADLKDAKALFDELSA